LPVTILACISLLTSCSSPNDGLSAGDLTRLQFGSPGPAAKSKSNPATFELPPGIELEKGITAEQAVAIALWNNAAFQSALTGLGISRAEVIQAGQLTNPTFFAFFPVGPKQMEFAAKFPAEAIWLRPRRVEIAEKNAGIVANGLEEGGLELIRQVKIACADLELAKHTLSATREANNLLSELARLAKARVEAGDAGELEAARAQAAASLAAQSVMLREADLTLAEQRLRALLGMASQARPVTLTGCPLPRGVATPVEEVMKEAWAARPDLRSTELALEAAIVRKGLTKTDFLPVLVVLDSNGLGHNFELGPGLDLTLPIFHQNQAAKVLADANVAKAAAEYVSVRERIAAEVREAYAQLQKASRERASWDRTMPSLENVATQARTAYELGDLSRIEALDAARTLADSKVQMADALARQRRGLADLERAVGRQF